MAFESLNGWTAFPPPPSESSRAWNDILTYLQLNGAGKYLAMVTTAPKSGTVIGIGFGVRIVTTPGDVLMRVETAASGGLPSGTPYHANASVTVAIGSGDANKFRAGAFPSGGFSVTKGDVICLIARRSSGDYGLTIVKPYLSALAYQVQTGIKSQQFIIAGLQYSDGWIPVDGCLPCNTMSGYSFNTGSTPDEVGVKFRVPAKMKITGAWAFVGGWTNSPKLRLYDSDGSTVLAEWQDAQGARFDDLSGIRYMRFPSDIELEKDTWYRLTILPTSGAAHYLNYASFQNADVNDGWYGGQNWIATERTDAGAWTDTSTRRPFMGLMIEEVETSADTPPRPTVSVLKVVDRTITISASGTGDTFRAELYNRDGSLSTFAERSGAGTFTITVPKKGVHYLLAIFAGITSSPTVWSLPGGTFSVFVPPPTPAVEGEPGVGVTTVPSSKVEKAGPLGTGLAFPFRFSSTTGAPEMSYGLDHVVDGMIQVLLTRRWSRIIRRDFGSIIGGRLFSPDIGRASDIQSGISDALSRWEQRVSVSGISVYSDRDKGKLFAEISFTALKTYQPGSFVVQLPTGGS